MGFCSRKFFLENQPEGGFLMTVVLLLPLLFLFCSFSLYFFFRTFFMLLLRGFDSAFVGVWLGRIWGKWHVCGFLQLFYFNFLGSQTDNVVVFLL